MILRAWHSLRSAFNQISFRYVFEVFVRGIVFRSVGPRSEPLWNSPRAHWPRVGNMSSTSCPSTNNSARYTISAWSPSVFALLKSFHNCSRADRICKIPSLNPRMMELNFQSWPSGATPLRKRPARWIR